MILAGQLGIGDFVLYAGCVRNLAEALQILMRTFAKLRKCSAEVNDYRAYNEFCDAQSGGEEKLPEAKEYTVTFENVSFKYPGREDYALRNLNLTLPFGEKLAVVGLNGAGKTTFVKLLLKLYQPTEGRILLGGVDLRKIDTEEYYALFAPVFQDLELYAFSLAENVSMKTREATDSGRAKECLERAGLGEKLKEWPKGIETPMLRILHDDGILLSGGEKQKMALARALYKDAPIVVLDEPTAALDALSESEIYERFDSFVRGKSAVYVSYRLASTRFCDRIVMFENGELVECGSHEELMELGGKYAQLFELQAKYYQEENDETVAC
jgi:ABC-type multidrug transport system fused ATPase/permease subunit